MVFTSSTNGSPESESSTSTRPYTTRQSAQRLFLNLLRLGWIDFRRANVLGTAAGLRIQKRVLVVEVVKTALRNYFKNRQGQITKNTYRQLAARHKFFY